MCGFGCTNFFCVPPAHSLPPSKGSPRARKLRFVLWDARSFGAFRRRGVLNRGGPQKSSSPHLWWSVGIQNRNVRFRLCRLSLCFFRTFSSSVQRDSTRKKIAIWLVGCPLFWRVPEEGGSESYEFRKRAAARTFGAGCCSLVERRGFEPLTPTLPVLCAPNCANAPFNSPFYHITFSSFCQALFLIFLAFFSRSVVKKM